MLVLGALPKMQALREAMIAELVSPLLEALGRQQQRADGSDEPGELEAQLAKAYELFRRAYEACRHAIVYVRRNEGDADTIAPPLGQSRRRTRRAEADDRFERSNSLPSSPTTGSNARVAFRVRQRPRSIPRINPSPFINGLGTFVEELVQGRRRLGVTLDNLPRRVDDFDPTVEQPSAVPDEFAVTVEERFRCAAGLDETIGHFARHVGCLRTTLEDCT